MPQLFVAAEATKFNDPKNFPWTMAWQPSYQGEAAAYAAFLLKENPDAKIAGDDLTRENVMRQAANLKDWRTEALLPGIKMNTSPTDFAPISQLQPMRFKGETWELFGDVFTGDVTQ